MCLLKYVRADEARRGLSISSVTRANRLSSDMWLHLLTISELIHVKKKKAVLYGTEKQEMLSSDV
jgi:hypothetical protein